MLALIRFDPDVKTSELVEISPADCTVDVNQMSLLPTHTRSSTTK